MPLEGCLHGRRDWRRLIQGRKESGMVNPLEFCVLVGIDHRAGRLVGRLHREGGVVQPGQSGSPLDGGLDPGLGTEIHAHQKTLLGAAGFRLGGNGH